MTKDNNSWTETVEETQIPEEKRVSNKKRKVSIVNVIVLILLLILGIIFFTYFLSDSKQIGKCQTQDQCGRYNVFYFKGDGYICANNEKMNQSSLKERVLTFKYASSYAVEKEPSGCSCTQSRCQIEE
ncbi:MAG: hypothetical protein ABEI74_03515 [Candidatus Pacearchaeota archaeon]